MGMQIKIHNIIFTKHTFFKNKTCACVSACVVKHNQRYNTKRNKERNFFAESSLERPKRVIKQNHIYIFMCCKRKITTMQKASNNWRNYNTRDYWQQEYMSTTTFFCYFSVGSDHNITFPLYVFLTRQFYLFICVALTYLPILGNWECRPLISFINPTRSKYCCRNTSISCSF